MKLHGLLDGSQVLAQAAERVGFSLAEAANVARALELYGLLERRERTIGASILVVEDDPEAVRMIQSVLGPHGAGCQLRVVRDRVGAQLLLRRQTFDLVILALDQPEQQTFFETCRSQVPSSTRFVGIVGMEDESQVARLDELGLDGVLHRPLVDSDLRATVHHLLGTGELASVAG
jgi:CheY-like chemotaxis protein